MMTRKTDQGQERNARPLDHRARSGTRRAILRADKLAGCTEGSEEELELKMIADTVGAYETKRWPDGKVPGGKG
jgi:hypothetical protein